jgi:phospholipase/lecithinase/hemolysin
MNRNPPFRFNQLALATILLSAAFGSAQAGDYSNVYFFGDSLSDNGAYAPILPVPTNARFTTNPGTVWTDNLGANYGKAVTTAYAASLAPTDGFAPIVSGNNFAVGGARVSLQPGIMTPLRPPDWRARTCSISMATNCSTPFSPIRWLSVSPTPRTRHVVWRPSSPHWAA